MAHHSHGTYWRESGSLMSRRNTKDVSREQYIPEDRRMVDILTRALLESRVATTDQILVRLIEAMFAHDKRNDEELFEDY